MSNTIAPTRHDPCREDCLFIHSLWEYAANREPLSGKDVLRYGLHPDSVGFIPFDTGDTWEIFNDVFVTYEAFLSVQEPGQAAARVLSILHTAQDRGLLHYIDTVSQNKLFFVKFRDDLDYGGGPDSLLSRYGAEDQGDVEEDED